MYTLNPNVIKAPADPIMAIGTLAFLLKYEEWIMKAINDKKPINVFDQYMFAISKIKNDPHFNLINLADGQNSQFYQELFMQMYELFNYDVELCL